MLAPISWLKDFVDIKLPLKELMWEMTGVGLTCETFQKIDGEIVLDVEVTANRPDWMSMMGIAREIAAIQNSHLNNPKIFSLPQPDKTLAITYKIDYQLLERWSAIVFSDVTIKPSPERMQKRLKLIGLRPINNLIDITNYVMFELGIPMHVFDYDEIKGQKMSVERANGGEKFTTVDELSYKLPKDAMIIRDSERIIDLVGIKGGLNSGVKSTTKNILLHVTIDNPILIRRASQALGLRSEASAIYERGPDKDGTVNSLKRAANLILELAGGKVASEIIDLKEKEFKPWKVDLNLSTLENVLGIAVPKQKVFEILTRLHLSPKISRDKITCTIPTYRADIKAEEDLIEEVARIYGYNKFPLTLPTGTTPVTKVPYCFDDSFHLKIKDLLVSCGFSEAMTLSLISKDLIEKCNLKTQDHIRLANPVSLEYEYLRNSLILSLLTSIKLNPDETKLQLFEIDKIFSGRPGKTNEPYKLAAIAKGLTFREFKGTFDLLLTRLNLSNAIVVNEVNENIWHPSKSGYLKVGNETIGTFGEIHPRVLQNLAIAEACYALEIDLAKLEKYSLTPVFKVISAYPPQIEDLTLTFPEKTRIGDVVHLISSIESLVSRVELTDTYKDSYTFRIWYQHPTKTLTDAEVAVIRNKILSGVKQKFGGTLK